LKKVKSEKSNFDYIDIENEEDEGELPGAIKLLDFFRSY
jgi:hypothetical protein